MPVVYSNHYSQNPDFYEELFRDTDYYDSYLGILEQYKNEPTGTFFGSITGKNEQRRYEHYQNRDAALNALLEQMRSDQYNSSASQVARDREAGLNPDLLGASGGAESAPVSSAGLPLTPDDSFQQVVSGATNFLTFVSGALLSAQSAIGQSLVNQGLRLDNTAKAIDVVTSALSNDEPQHPVPFVEGNIPIEPTVKFGFSTGNKRLDKRLERYAKALYDSPTVQAGRYKNKANISGARVEDFNNTSSPYYTSDDSLYAESAKLVAQMSGQIFDLQQIYEKAFIQTRNGTLEASALNNQDEFTSDYFDSLDGEGQANADNLRYQDIVRYYKKKSELLDTQRSLLGLFEKRAKLGDPDAIETVLHLYSDGVWTSPAEKNLNVALGIGSAFRK